MLQKLHKQIKKLNINQENIYSIYGGQMVKMQKGKKEIAIRKWAKDMNM